MNHEPAHVELLLAGERVVLLGAPALWRPRDRTVFVADVHLGKAATFRAHGIAVPPGTTATTLDRLAHLIRTTGAERLVVLGDLLHARAGRQPHLARQLGAWRAAHAELTIELVRGNHDRLAGDPDDALGITPRDAPVTDGAFALRHHPVGEPFWLAGHLHPGVSLAGNARQRLFLPCFHLTARGMVLPAFGDFTGLAAVDPAPADRVFAIAGGEVIEVSHPR